MEHSAILSTFIKLPFVVKIFVLSIFEWPLKTGFTVHDNVPKQLVSRGGSMFRDRPREQVQLPYFSIKTYVEGTHKNCLYETVLLSTQNTCFN